MNETKHETIPARCTVFVPMQSEISGATKRCRFCGGYEHEHGDQPPATTNGNGRAALPVDLVAIPNGDPGIFKFTITTRDTLRNVAEILAQRWKNHAKVADDPEAEIYARLFAAAPKLYRSGKSLAEVAKRLNDLQHAGQEVDPSMWGELYQLVNEMRAAVAEAEEPI